jgi:ribosomal protein S18 acetylase RimI-like enzyme
MFSREGYGLLPVSDVDDALFAAFDCGISTLNDFLRQHATDFHARRLSFTSLVLHQDYYGLLCFFSLSTDGLKLNDSERFDLDIQADFAVSYVSAVMIGRLAVASECHGKGVGSMALDLIRGEAIKAPARLLVVDAVDEAVPFYEKNGFQEALFAKSKKAPNKNSRTTKMWLDLIV